ncbi:hypothetical protein B0T17DRAFT_519423 [Bombardia bombarda]|uniref:Uncharacterized protein n=1 Tax=Bombardia bombarda TaxID=252184 RepID=A0AA39XM43_9PEZI|nr:hypothetical protein B0T17DRAFT_519423 [Bombardia bombarda]
MELCLSSECRGSYNNYRRRMVAKRCREFGLEPVKRNWTIKMEDIHYSSYIFEREVTWIEKGETRMAIGLFILDCPKCNWTDLSRTYLPHEKEALAHLRTCGVPTAGLKDDQDVFTTYSTIITPNNKQEAVTRMWAREHNMSLFNFVFGPKDPKFPHDEVALKRRGDEDEDAILPGERLLMAQQRKANERQSPSPVLPECRQTHQEKEENVTISQSAPSTRLNQRVAKKAGPLKRSSQKSRMVIDNESDDDILSPPNRLRQEPRGGASNGRLLRRHLPGPSQMDQQNEENFTTYQTAPSNRLDQGPSENEGPTKRSQKRRRDDDMDDESDFDIPGPSKRPRQESHSQDRAFNARSSRQTLPSSRQTRSQRVTRFTAQNSAATELDQGPENKAVQAARSQKRRRDAAPDSDADSEDHEQDEDYVPRPKPSKRQKVSQDENGEETNRGSRSKKGKSVSRPRKRVSFAEPPVSPTHSNQNRPISPQKSILKGKGSTHDPK